MPIPRHGAIGAAYRRLAPYRWESKNRHTGRKPRTMPIAKYTAAIIRNWRFSSAKPPIKVRVPTPTIRPPTSHLAQIIPTQTNWSKPMVTATRTSLMSRSAPRFDVVHYHGWRLLAGDTQVPVSWRQSEPGGRKTMMPHLSSSHLLSKKQG
jgi:hypothetical protein